MSVLNKYPFVNKVLATLSDEEKWIFKEDHINECN